jgi:predicted alpha/beta superfamily hydrolase
VAALLRVHYPSGGHTIEIIGSATGLSWTRGAPTSVSGNTFSYAFESLSAAAEWKPVLDGGAVARGANYRVEPGQTVDVWPHFLTAKGTVETLVAAFHSVALGNDRPIYVYLPPSYAENTEATYPVVYMHDGQNLWGALPQLPLGANWNVDGAFDAAAETGACSGSGAVGSVGSVGWAAQPPGGVASLCTGDGDCPSGECRTFPEAIIIGVGNTPNRIFEYTPTTDPSTPGGGGGDLYLQMLAGELKPTVDAMLRTRPGRGSTVLAGSSLGGLITAYAGWKRPDVFALVAELSPSAWWNGNVIVADVGLTRASPDRPLAVYVDSGAGAGDDQADTDLLAAAYVAQGYVEGVNFRHVVQAGAVHSEIYWAQRFPGAMQLLLGAR